MTMRLSVFAALCLCASPAFGQRQAGAAPPDGPPPDARLRPAQTATIMAEPVALFIAACDADGDARVTRAELTTCVAKSFAAIDGEHRGWLGYIQFADWAERWLGDRNALPSPFETDSDGDNHITLAELQAQFDKIFTRFDRDKDGVLTRAELLTLDGSRGFGPPGGPGGPGGRGRRRRP